MKKFSEEIVEHWITLYQAGNTLKAIASAYGTSPRIVSLRLAKAGALRKRAVVTQEMVKEWIALYQAGNTLNAIASASGFSRCSVYFHLDKAGVLIKRTVITTKMIKEWIALYKTGRVNCSYIARKYKVRRNTVVNYLRMNGVKTSRHVPRRVEI